MDSAVVLAPANQFTPSIWSPPSISLNESLPERSKDPPRFHGAMRQRWRLWAGLFIGLVSAYDAWLVKVYAPVMCDVEKNPIARYIIVSSNDAVGPFLLCKAAGTLAVLTILWLMCRHLPRLAPPVIYSVALFQLLLVVFIHVAES